jgi:hypothetical protein
MRIGGNGDIVPQVFVVVTIVLVVDVQRRVLAVGVTSLQGAEQAQGTVRTRWRRWAYEALGKPKARAALPVLIVVVA